MDKKIVTFIYTLEDPDTGEVRYVGKTTNLKHRMWRHMKNARDGQKIYVSCWIRGLVLNGKSPVMDVIDQTDDDDWESLERFYISYLRSLGVRLTNLTDGGEGTLGHKHTEETKRKLSEINTGRKQTPEAIEKTRKFLTGKPKKPSSVAKQAAALRGRKLSPERIAIRTAKIIGRKNSPETIERMRLAQLGKTMSMESRIKISLRRKGVKLSDQIRAKMSASHTGTKYSPERLANSRRLRSLRNLQKVVDNL